MKDDTVSRAAVMQSLTREYNRRRTGDGLKLAWIEKAVDEVPAVQPKDPENGSASCINPEKMHDRTMDECISRQAVLKSIDDYERLSAVSQTVRNMTSLREIVQQLPSVQPETHDKRTETHACDLISRQAAIDAVIGCMKDNRANGIVEKIKRLPSVQPEQHTCVNCGRTVNNGGWYADGRTRCPIEEHYALPKDGYCHLWEKRNITDDDYPERRTDE